MSTQALARALEAHQAGRLVEAEAIYREILQTQPAYFDALHLLGVLEFQNGRLDEADRLISRSLQINPQSAEAHSNRGIVLAARQRHTEALADYEAALAIKPNYADALYNRANTLRELRLHELALADYDLMLAASPKYANAWNNRAISLNALKRYEEALDSCDKALAIRSEYVEAWNNRGVTLANQRRFEEALASYNRALSLNPDYPEALNNCGQVFEALGRHDEAIPMYARAQTLRPDYAEAHCNEGLCRLALGDYERGWKQYEWRWRNPSLGLTVRELARPRWSGMEDLRGKSIFLHMEQGLGDAIQALRYVPMVAAKGATVILEIVPALTPLVARLKGVSQIVIRGEKIPDTDFHCPLLSLPMAFGTQLNTIPARVPYLSIDKRSILARRSKLAERGRKLVGICWRGNPEFPRDQERSCKFAQVMPFLTVPGVRFVSMQKDLTADELRDARVLPRFFHDDSDFKTAAETVAALDLLITVDTSWAHWAGAIGKQCWLLLPFSAHWVWLTGRGDSPWYPTIRLFRQSRIGNWDDVVEDVKDELVGWLRK